MRYVYRDLILKKGTLSGQCGDCQALIACWRSGPEKVRIWLEKSEFWLL